MDGYKLILINGKAITAFSCTELIAFDPDPLDRRQHFKFLSDGKITSKVYPLVLDICDNRTEPDSKVGLSESLSSSPSHPRSNQKWQLTSDQFLLSEHQYSGNSKNRERYLGFHSDGSGALVITTKDATHPCELLDAPQDITIQISNATSEPVTIFYKSPNGTRVHLEPVIPIGADEVTFTTSPGARHVFAGGNPLHPSHIKAIDREHVIIRSGTVPKHQITLRNNTGLEIEVSAIVHVTEEERSIRVFTLAPEIVYVFDLEEGTKLKATAMDGITAVHPCLKRVDGPETFIFTCDLHVPEIEREAIRRWLPNKVFTLLYKATRDGFDVTQFEHFCNFSGPAIAIITSSQGYRFGGYAADGWEHSYDYWNTNPSSFTFSLSNPLSSHPTQHAVVNLQGKCGYWMGTSRHLSFGANDIFLDITGTKGYIRSANDPTSLFHHPSPSSYTGNAHFDVHEIEVYLVR